MHPAVTALIIGPRTLEQLESQLGALDVTLSAEVFDAIDDIRTRLTRTLLKALRYPLNQQHGVVGGMTCAFQDRRSRFKKQS